MSNLGPQDGDLEEEELEADIETPEPSNGVHAGAPDIKISFPKGPRRGKAAVEGQAALDALTALGGDGKAFSIAVMQSADQPRPASDIGVLPFTLSAADLAPDRLAARIGGGTFRISLGKAERIVTLVGPLRSFGPVKGSDPDSSYHWMQTPNGPQLINLPRGVPPPPAMMPGFGFPWGSGQQQQPDIGKAVAEALKPFLELLTKRDDGGAGKWGLEIEKMKLEQTREESKARIAEAKENAAAAVAAAKESRLLREAELKHQGETEGKRLQYQADAQVKAAEALAKAQTEMAQASIKAAELRAKGEEGQVDKFFKWQERLAPHESPLTEAVSMYKVIHGLAGNNTLATILEGLPKVVQTIGGEVRAIASLPAPQQPGAAPAPPAAPPPLADDTRGEIEEFMSVVKTVRTAIREKKDPGETVALLQPSAPRVLAFIAQSEPKVLGDKLAALTQAHDSHVSGANKAIVSEVQQLFTTAEGAAWFVAFYGAITTAINGGKKA